MRTGKSKTLSTIKLSLFLFSISLTQSLQAGEILAAQEKYYYGEELDSLRGEDLKKSLHQVLNSHHISRVNDFDEIVSECSIEENENCYVHRKLSYKEAREHLFGFLHLEGNSPSKYYVTTLYCLTEVDNDVLPKNKSLGPGKIPSASVLNTEHAWPQSHFTGNFPKTLQKGDLHALFPVLMKVNSTRSNHPYGKVSEVTSKVCDRAALGKNEKGQIVFEPAVEVKGDVARATFYFSTRYSIKIEATEEAVLREWHRQDPVDEHEKWRNDQVYQIQYIRNPYVDEPKWVDRIGDF